MRIRFPILLFSVLGILGSIGVLILIFIKLVGGSVPFEHILKSHGLWDAFVTAVTITCVLSVLSLSSGLVLRKGGKFRGFIGIFTSGMTILFGLLGTYTEIIPLGPNRTFIFFYISLLPVGIIMLISMAVAWKEIWLQH